LKGALSVRIAESPRNKAHLNMPFEDLAALIAEAGFDGVSMRASAVDVDASPERVARMRQCLNEHGLEVSMVTGDLGLAVNDASATAALGNITPYLDLAESLGSSLVRVMLHDERDIELAQEAADQAQSRGITLCQQTHWGSLCETVDEALDVCVRVDRRNFGLTLEPANLLACSGRFDEAMVERLLPCVKNVYFQNIRLDSSSSLTFRSRLKGPVGVAFVPIISDEGMDVGKLISALRTYGYHDWFTVHQPLLEGETVGAAVHSAARLLPMLRGESR
jgi:sugar phosphate isomerase/epimerase